MAPFDIRSNEPLDEIKQKVGEKTNSFPGMIQLCYKLDTDKVKAAPTSISSDYELSTFYDRMKNLIVPPKLANGKYSQKKMKPVQVIFSDSVEGTELTNNAAKKAKKVSQSFIYFMIM
jgi:hypothetical protein